MTMTVIENHNDFIEYSSSQVRYIQRQYSATEILGTHLLLLLLLLILQMNTIRVERGVACVVATAPPYLLCPSWLYVSSAVSSSSPFR